MCVFFGLNCVFWLVMYVFLACSVFFGSSFLEKDLGLRERWADKLFFVLFHLSFSLEKER